MESIKEFPRGIWIRSLAQEGATAHAKRAPGPGLKLPDSRSFIKFQAASIKGLDYNKTIDRVSHMKGNLVW